MAETPKWTISQLAAEVEGVLARGIAGDGQLIEGRAMQVKASPELGNSDKIVMGMSALPPHFSTVLHSHEAEEVAVGISGSGWLDINGKAHPMETGTVIIAPSNLPHTTRSGPDGLTVLWFYAPPGSEVRWLEPDAEGEDPR
ncbi:MAG: cupin domain-containing protein [bacterium]|nr:cupin domain-containing protein [bacterium]MDE0234585.1 cupin domain-containing protein [bacterium]